ncbi:LysM peptidoglycan-binding domain-containing protein [Psychromonas sp. KJ10-10]|uniref:LysM peptidoglycan-binding domain-containing protein n=1 Tax=Psychromonas sp. KJ10-10 TaxID=3391823 RepID=UPI0039B3F813
MAPKIISIPAYHKVQRGESLSVIASRYNKTTNELKRYNKLSSTVLSVGQRLAIPGATAENDPAPAKVLVAKATVHRVKRGESLSVIAARYNQTINNLKTYNDLRSSSLAIGQRIKIPAGDYVASEDKRTKQATVHKVQRGESLSVIACTLWHKLSRFKGL